MTLEVILYFMKNLCLHNVSMHRHFYQNQFITNMLERKKLKSRSHGVPEFFLVRYRRTKVLKNYFDIIQQVQENNMIHKAIECKI